MASSSRANSGGRGGDPSAKVNIICTICIQTLMKEGTVQVTTPCGHLFHKHCLLQWYASRKPNRCPDCGKCTKTDPNCEFRLFPKCEEDFEYLNILKTVSNLQDEKNEIIQQLRQEKKMALELLTKENEKAMNLVRVEHSQIVEILRQDYEHQINRLKEENTATLNGVRLENFEKTEQLRKLVQFQGHEIELMKKEIKYQMNESHWHKEQIQNLKMPIDLLQERVNTLASAQLKQEVDGLDEKYKRLLEACGFKPTSAKCDEDKATGVRGDGASTTFSQENNLGKSTSGLFKVPVVNKIPSCESELQGTSFITTSWDTKTLSEGTGLIIINENETSINDETSEVIGNLCNDVMPSTSAQISPSVSASSTTLSQKRSSKKNNVVNAAAGTSRDLCVAYKKQKIDDKDTTDRKEQQMPSSGAKLGTRKSARRSVRR